MSHIPSSVMPHAKPHEPDQATDQPGTAKAVASGFPWLAFAIGGAVAAGTAVASVMVLRRRATASTRRNARKPATKRVTKVRTPRRKAVAKAE